MRRINVFVLALFFCTSAFAQKTPRPKPTVRKADIVAEPYSLKGDRLGMWFTDFKKSSYEAMAGWTGRGGLFCSNDPDAGFTRSQSKSEFLSAGKAEKKDPELAAGLISCSLMNDYDEEKGFRLTVANVPTKSQVLNFLDSKLYRIEASFSQVPFQKVRGAFIDKYGRPASTETKSYQNAFGATFPGEVLRWTNGVSEILLEERGVDLETSRAVFTHLALAKEAEARKPRKGPDL